MILSESADGVANIDEIVWVEEVGAISIGPSEFAMSLGVGPLLNGIVLGTEAAIQTVLAACKRAGVVCGIADSREASDDRRIGKAFGSYSPSSALHDGQASMASRPVP